MKNITKCQWSSCNREKHFDEDRQIVRRWCSVHCAAYAAQVRSLPIPGRVIPFAAADRVAA